MRPEKYPDIEIDGTSSCPSERNADDIVLLDELSQRVLRHWNAQAWRELFLGPAHATIRFRRAALTLLLADSPLHLMERGEAGLLAQHLRAEPDAEVSSSAELAMSFREPEAALRAALVLQRLVHGRPVRAALTTGACIIASFELGGAPRQLVIGPELERAEASVQATPPGTIAVAAETYALVAELLAHEVRDAMVATELVGDRVTRASITLAPPRTAAISTFAGLGLA